MLSISNAILMCKFYPYYMYFICFSELFPEFLWYKFSSYKVTLILSISIASRQGLKLSRSNDQSSKKKSNECVISGKTLKHYVVFFYKNKKISWIIKFCNTKKIIGKKCPHPTATIIVFFMGTVVKVVKNLFGLSRYTKISIVTTTSWLCK